MNLVKFVKKRDFIPFLLLLLFAAQGISSLNLKAPTWDETNYFGLGYYIFKNRRWDVPASTLHPPLSYYLNSFPYLFLEVDEGAWDLPPSLKCPDCSHYTNPTAGLRLITDKRYPRDRVLFFSRLSNISISLLLGYYLWRWVSELYGSLSARCALFLFAFCPNILAHARLITPDITLTCFNFLSIYYFWKVIKLGRWDVLLTCALMVGMALLSKYTALLLLPIFLAISTVIFFSQECIVLPTPFPFRIWLMKKCALFRVLRLVILLAIIMSGALVLLKLGYLGHLDPYFKGIVHQWRHAGRGHPSFLMGQYSTQGWWYYHLAAFCIKSPLPFLLFVIISFGYPWSRSGELLFSQACIIIPVVIYFLFFSIVHQCIGLRYILPVYPFLFIQAGWGMSRLLEDKRMIRKVLVIGLSCWYIKSSITIYPHYLAYFNELVGGPDNGYKYLVDSNLDWGQDLKGLAKYMGEKGIVRIHLSYFGTADPHYYGINYEWMPSYYLPEDCQEEEVRRYTRPKTGVVAISATNLQGVYFSDKNFYHWLKSYKPVDKIGYSIFIYDLDSESNLLK